MKSSFTTREGRCPNCGNELSGATSVTDRKALPNPGDLSVCMYCAELLEFRKDLTLARLSDRDVAALPEEARQALLRAQDLVRRFNDEV
jgi:hypothetical protein